MVSKRNSRGGKSKNDIPIKEPVNPNGGIFNADREAEEELKRIMKEKNRKRKEEKILREEQGSALLEELPQETVPLVPEPQEPAPPLPEPQETVPLVPEPQEPAQPLPQPQETVPLVPEPQEPAVEPQELQEELPHKIQAWNWVGTTGYQRSKRMVGTLNDEGKYDFRDGDSYSIEELEEDGQKWKVYTGPPESKRKKKNLGY